jgi:hypothetical protein
VTKLQSLLKSAALLLGCGLLALSGYAVWETLRMEREVKTSLVGTLDKSKQTFTELNRFTLEAELTARNLREASGAWKDASKQQTQMIAETGGRVGVLLADSDALVRRTDETLNGKIGPQAAGLLAAANGTVNGLTTATAVATKTLADADRVVTDPAITATVTNMAKIGDEAVSISRNLTKSTEDMNAMTADARAYVHRVTKPASQFWGLLKTIGITAAKLVVVFAN